MQYTSNTEYGVYGEVGAVTATKIIELSSLQTIH